MSLSFSGRASSSVAPAAALPGGTRAVSITSPLGAAVVGKSEGDEVEVQRGGTTASYCVSEVV